MNSESSAATRSLTLRYVFALFAIAATCLATQVVVQVLLGQMQNHAQVVNIAGRQRMLSQQLAKLSLQFAAGMDSASTSILAAELQRSRDELTQVHNRLRFGDAKLGLLPLADADVQDQLRELDPTVNSLAELSSKLLVIAQSGATDTAATRPIAAQMTSQSSVFLSKMDATVQSISAHSAQQVGQLIWLERLIVCATLLLLLLEALFVFRPAVTRVGHAVSGLSSALSQVQSATSDAKNAIAERNLALSAAAIDLKRLAAEIDSVLLSQLSIATPSDGQRCRLMIAHVQNTLTKLTNLNQGDDSVEDRLLVSRISPRSLIRDTVQRFQRDNALDDDDVVMTMDERLPATMLVDEQLFRNAIGYVLHAVADSTDTPLSVHIYYDDRHLRLQIEIDGCLVVAEPSPGQKKKAMESVELESLDLLLAKRFVQRLGGSLQAMETGEGYSIGLPLDETKRMNLFSENDRLQRV